MAEAGVQEGVHGWGRETLRGERLVGEEAAISVLFAGVPGGVCLQEKLHHFVQWSVITKKLF